jgi:hypothetical protein
MDTAEKPGSRVGHITLDRKRAGKPIAGNRHDGFEAAGAGNQLTVWLVRHSQRKRGATDRLNLRSMAPVLDPTRVDHYLPKAGDKHVPKQGSLIDRRGEQWKVVQVNMERSAEEPFAVPFTGFSSPTSCDCPSRSERLWQLIRLAILRFRVHSLRCMRFLVTPRDRTTAGIQSPPPQMFQLSSLVSRYVSPNTCPFALKASPCRSLHFSNSRGLFFSCSSADAINSARGISG